jgi:peptide/nickel transport system ATP-binding protein
VIAEVLDHVADDRGYAGLTAAQRGHRDGGPVAGDRPGDDKPGPLERIAVDAVTRKHRDADAFGDHHLAHLGAVGGVQFGGQVGAEQPVHETVLEARHITKVFRGPDKVDRTVVDDVSFELYAGETLGIVGESGSGKTTSARIALSLLGPTSGGVLLHGQPWSALPPARRRPLRKQIGVIYQDPLSSFDPRWPVGRILTDALRTGSRPPSSRTEAQARAVRLLEQVGLGEQHLAVAPLRLSGGQRQRVAIARALAPGPEVIVCDEPVSALDVSIQAQVLDLLTDLQDELGVSYLFISHDLGVIHHMSDRILVMMDGRVVESGTADEVFEQPRDPYTQRLLTALPRLAQA